MAEFIRPLFDYTAKNPSELSFEAHEVLKVIEINDEDFWVVVNTEGAQGKIPSKAAYEREFYDSEEFVRYASAVRATDRTASIEGTHYRNPRSIAVPSYEPIEYVSDTGSTVRPLVIVGPGAHKVTEGVVAALKESHQAELAVATTSRPKKNGEEEGVQYYFTSKTAMENGIKEKEYLEIGESNGNLYGQSIKKIKEPSEHGKLVVVDVTQPKAITSLKKAGIHPIVVFLEPTPESELSAAPRRFAKVTETLFGSLFTHKVPITNLQEVVNNVVGVVTEVISAPFWATSSATLPGPAPPKAGEPAISNVTIRRHVDGGLGVGISGGMFEGTLVAVEQIGKELKFVGPFGQLEEGDAILAVDGVNVIGCSNEDAAALCHNGADTVTFKICSRPSTLSIKDLLTGDASVAPSGTQELKRLVQDRFYQAAIPYTTRPQRPDEVDGKDYHFVTKDEFMELVAGNQMLEGGKSGDYYYGTRQANLKPGKRPAKPQASGPAGAPARTPKGGAVQGRHYLIDDSEVLVLETDGYSLSTI